MKTRLTGFSLVELLVTIACMMALLGPVVLILQSGTRASLKGMLQVDTTLQARSIIRQVHTDLKLACIPTTSGAQDLTFATIVTRSGSAPESTWSFYAFPVHGRLEDMVPALPTGKSGRQATLITYRLAKSADPKKPFFTLTRTETYHPDHPLGATPIIKLLSDRVNFFEIQSFEKRTGSNIQGYFWVNLQLIDALHPSALEQAAVSRSQAGTKPAQLLIADFFDVVYPEFFNAILNNERINRNWHALIVGPARE